METRDKNIADWLRGIENGSICLPDFQREEVWKPEFVEKFLWAILQDRPLGIFLTLEMNENNQQEIETKAMSAKSGTCELLILDGQQRLTALWRSLNNYYGRKEYFVKYKKDATRFISEEVICQNKDTFPDQSIPIQYLKPGEEAYRDLDIWLKNEAADEAFREFIHNLRKRISETNIPYYKLPAKTDIGDVIDIFTDTNTYSVKLKAYDLAVALMKRKTKTSLKKLVENIETTVTGIQSLEKPVGELLLKIQCLREDKKPNYYSFLKDLDYGLLKKDVGKIKKGLVWTVELLSNIGIKTEQRLPSVIPLRVLPALHEHVPSKGSDRGHAIKLAKKYLWWSFLTNRYDRQANDRLKEDFDGLKKILTNGINIDEKKLKQHVPIFKCKKPNLTDIKQANWPRTRSAFGRAILAVCSLADARDIATGDAVCNQGDVDYHHIFPKNKLEEGKVRKKEINLAINCMLLKEDTNRRKWRNKLPGDFLDSEIKNARKGDKCAPIEIERRLETHVLQFSDLQNITDSNIEKKQVKAHYKKFIDDRSKRVKGRIDVLLANGEL